MRIPPCCHLLYHGYIIAKPACHFTANNQIKRVFFPSYERTVSVRLLLQIVNSVVMNHVVIEDGCHIQGSVVCNNVQLQERAVLKDCQVIFFL
jgi:NDP-sugar pyrophosphorylase family protein